jgi:hypothetical protein
MAPKAMAWAGVAIAINNAAAMVFLQVVCTEYLLVTLDLYTFVTALPSLIIDRAGTFVYLAHMSKLSDEIARVIAWVRERNPSDTVAIAQRAGVARTTVLNFDKPNRDLQRSSLEALAELVPDDYVPGRALPRKDSYRYDD